MKSNRRDQQPGSNLPHRVAYDQRSSEAFKARRPTTLSWVVERTGQVAKACRSTCNEVLPPQTTTRAMFTRTPEHAIGVQARCPGRPSDNRQSKHKQYQENS